MIKVTTTQAHAADAARRRIHIIGQAADAVEALLRHIPACKHKDGRIPPTCVRCAERRMLADALNAVCDTGGIPRRGDTA